MCLLWKEIKQSRLGHSNMHIVLPSFPDDTCTRICIVQTLAIYLDRTRLLGNSSRLFISTVQLHGAVSKDTLARWIKTALCLAGIDVTMFKPNSTRAAATSAAQRKGVTLAVILNAADWSNETTFAKYYNKPLRADLSLQSPFLELDGELTCSQD